MIWTFLVAFAVSVYRIRRKMFTKGEAVLWGLFLLNVVLVQLQLYVENWRFKVDLRYLSPAFVLLWGVCIWPIAELWKRHGKLDYVLIAVFVAALGVNIFRVVKHNFGMGNRSRKTLVSAWAANEIKKDWDGPLRDEKLSWSPREYNTRARPVINCASSYRSIAYLTGGRIYFPEVGGENKGDYWLVEGDDPMPDNARLVNTYSFKNRHFRLYRVPAR